MSKIRGVVYAPPLLFAGDFPEVAVVLLDKEVIGARAVQSIEAGEAFIASVLAGMGANNGKDSEWCLKAPKVRSVPQT